MGREGADRPIRGFDADPMIVADMVGRTKHPEAIFVLANDCVASRRIHHPIAGVDASIFCEEIAYRGKVMIIDREAVSCGKRADRAFGLEPFNAKRQVIVGHRSTMAHSIGNVQNAAEKECR
jgi:hypothetical protein